MARGKNQKKGTPAKAPQEATETKPTEESSELQSEEVAADVTTPEEAVETPDVPETEMAGGDVPEAAIEDVKAEGEKTDAPKDTPQKGKRKRLRGKKGKKPTGNGPASEQKKENKPVDFAGLIFMCNSETKKDCFKYRVFGLPEQKRNIVEHVKKGTRLFLFDIDKKVLHGVYKASSEGGMNLVEEAFKDSDRKFPAQVRFRILKDCMPLDESAFKLAINDNYISKNRFKCELSNEQVGKLVKLFRPLDSRGLPEPKAVKETKGEFTPRGRPGRGPPPRREGRNNRGPPPRFSAPAPPRERVYKDYAPAYVPPSYSLVSHADPELRHFRHVQEEALDRRGYIVDPVLEASIARKRYLEDVYAAEQQALIPKRPLLSDPLYRDLEYQRYADGLHSLSAGALPYGPRGY